MNIAKRIQSSVLADSAANGPAEPLAWIHEDELPPGYPYDAMFPYSKVDVVRMFPVYGPSAATGMDDAADAYRYRRLSVLGCTPSCFPPGRVLSLSTLSTFLDRTLDEGTWHACPHCAYDAPHRQLPYIGLLECHIGPGCKHCDGFGATWFSLAKE